MRNRTNEFVEMFDEARQKDIREENWLDRTITQEDRDDHVADDIDQDVDSHEQEAHDDSY